MTTDTEQVFDFVSIGAGVGGVTAAIAAAEFGLRSLIIEKTDKLGGVAAISGGHCWVPANHLEEQVGIIDSVESGFRYMLFAGGGYNDLVLARNYCERAREVIRFLEEKAGVVWQIIPVPDPLHTFTESVDSLPQGRVIEPALFPAETLGLLQQHTRKPNLARVVATSRERLAGVVTSQQRAERLQQDQRAGGGALMGYLIKNALDRGIEIWTNANTLELLRESGRVIGVRIQRNSEEHIVGARCGVALATGSYDSNDDYVRMFEPSNEASTVALASVSGDHLRLAGTLGAKIASPFRYVHTFLEPETPVVRDAEGTEQQSSSPVMFMEYAHCIVVNRYGKRFHNEASIPARDASISVIDLRAPWRLANLPCWAIWDSQHVARYLSLESTKTPGVVSALTIRDLARAIGIEAAGLEEQVDRFNRGASNGEDPDFGRGEWLVDELLGEVRADGRDNLGTIDRPPYYAARLVPKTMGIGRAGLVTNERSQVLDWSDQPIEGLYAAGNSVAMLELGIGYTGGNANTRGLVHGFCAAEHAAAVDN